MDECVSRSGLHELRFVRRELLGTTYWVVYRCVHCNEEFMEAEDDKYKGRDSQETQVS